ncbi:MAG: T9SS type A sorting domain-containing protein, partial [Candidatus Eisenbacteria bacterium]|nr:T9SS type A sorting domain-containing protein [Candidatus Eisenbacteria bacterium]
GTTVIGSASGVEEGSTTTSWTVDTPLSDGTYYWRSYAFDGAERGPLMDVGSFTVDGTGLHGDNVTSVALRQAHPNPFVNATTLSFELPASADVEFAVYSVDGRLVKTLVDGEASSGPSEVRWDGRDEQGLRVGSGLYFVKLVAGDAVRTGKLVVLR